MGRADFTSSHSIDIAAPPERCFDCLLAVDLTASPVAKALLTARGLRRWRRLDDMVAAGFTEMQRRPPHLLELAFVGRPWTLRGDIQRLAPEEVEAFATPGFVKAFWRFEIHPVGHGSRAVTTTTVTATDPAAQRAFSRYWVVVGPAGSVLRRAMLRRIRACAES